MLLHWNNEKFSKLVRSKNSSRGKLIKVRGLEKKKNLLTENILNELSKNSQTASYLLNYLLNLL